MTAIKFSIALVGAFVFAGTRYPMAIEWGPYRRVASTYAAWGWCV